MKPRVYDAEIDALLADLGLQDAAINWNVSARRQLTQGRRGSTLGMLTTHSDGSFTLTLSLGRERVEVLNTLAHELRHAWQKRNKVWTTKYLRGSRTRNIWRARWKGSDFAPSPREWEYATDARTGKPVVPRWTDPHEQDARGYARHALKRLFGLEYTETESHQEAARAALWKALGDD